MPTTQQLREQRANLFEQMKAASDKASAENRLMTGEETDSYNRLDAEYDKIENEIDRREALAAREANQVRKDPTVLDLGGEGEIDKSDEAYERAFTNFLRKGMNGLSAEDHAIMAAARDEKILNAAGVGTGAAGGFTVAPEFRDKLVETQKWYGPMLQEAEVIYTDTGAQLPVYQHRGEWWIAGRPGARYAVQVRNATGERVMGVMSVDGVNVISGDTASWDQSGYVLSRYQNAQITGWRKSSDEVAAFHFTALPQSYAARTGRPDHVGVIGVAVFREKAVPPPPIAPRPWPRALKDVSPDDRPLP